MNNQQVQQTRINKLLRTVDGLLSKVEQVGQQMFPVAWPQTNMPLLLGGIGKLKSLNRKQQLSVQQPEQARLQLNRALQKLQYGFAVAEQHELSLPLGTHHLGARHYVPQSSTRLPALLVYFHGGGFVLGNLESHDDICRLLCQQSGVQIIAVDYRLAPEHPFPAGLNDARAALRWVQAHAARFGVLPAQIAVGGDSAGANYAAVLAQESEGEIMVSLLIYPSTDRSRVWPSAQQFADSRFLSKADRQWFYGHYLGKSDSPATDPEVSPLLGLEQRLNAIASNQTNSADSSLVSRTLAATVLVTGGHDVLQDEGKAYAEALAQCGTTVKHLHFDRLDHGFMHFIGVNKVAYQATKQIALEFRQLCQAHLKSLSTATNT
jgi:acetyl esterase